MPRLTYTPEGADPKVWDFSFGRLRSSERIAIEKHTGMGWFAVQREFFSNSGIVVHALLWVLLRRDIANLKADEVDFCDDEIIIDVTDDEGHQALEALKAETDPDEATLVAIAELEARFAGVDPAAPKED